MVGDMSTCTLTDAHRRIAELVNEAGPVKGRMIGTNSPRLYAV